MAGLVSALALLAAACSDGGDDTAGSTAPAGSAPAPEATAAPADATTTAVDATAAPSTTGAPATTAEPATTPAPTTTEVPTGDAFYLPPDPLPGERPGDLIRAAPLADLPDGLTGWLLLYRSESLAGDPIAVSGVVITAEGTAPGDERPVLTWAHGTTGLADRCAPSKAYAGSTTGEISLAAGAVAQGWTFVATDYEGLGTPGVHPYLVGPSQGRGVLDIVRAARQVDGSGVTDGSPVAVFGHSQGGHAALMAGEIAPTYAPDVDLVGVVAGAPPGELALIERTLSGVTDVGGFALMIDAGFLAAYPDLPVDAAVAPENAELIESVADTCVTEAFALAGELTVPQPDASLDAEWSAAFEASSPGRVDPGVPVLIVHGDADDVVPAALSELIAGSYCANGATLQRSVYPGEDHISVIGAALPEVNGWIGARLAGEPAPSSC